MQINAAALIFHELVPGHHVHLSRQQENAALPEIRRNMPISTAFNEGWAEYASGWARKPDCSTIPMIITVSCRTSASSRSGWSSIPGSTRSDGRSTKRTLI
jgi:hypothetical protein